jgi:hypothetical protein
MIVTSLVQGGRSRLIVGRRCRVTGTRDSSLFHSDGTAPLRVCSRKANAALNIQSCEGAGVIVTSGYPYVDACVRLLHDRFSGVCVNG